MKQRGRKLLALLLSLCMVLALAGCAKDTKKDDAPTGGNQEQNDGKGKDDQGGAASTPIPTDEPKEVYEAFDFNKRTIKVGVWWDVYYTSEHQDVSDDPKVNNVETAQMRLENVRRIEEKYNCRIEFVNMGWNGIINSINNSIAAGTPECDIYLTDLQFGIPAVQNGLAQDLTNVVKGYSDLFDQQQIVKPLEGLGGTFFFGETSLPQSGIFLGYNKTMIEDLGLEDPQELYTQGKWTWDKFAELAKAGTRDTDNDGLTDIYGFGGAYTDLVNGLVMNNGGNIAANETEGLSSAQTVEALELVDRLYNKDLSARPWNGDDWNDNIFAWSDGKVMFWTGQAWSLEQESKAAIAEGAELPFDYHVVPYPVGPSGDGTIYSPVSGNWYIIPVGVQEPDKVLQVFEEYLNWHGGDAELRDDPAWFESCFLSMEDVDIALSCGENLKLDIWGSLGDYFSFSNTIWWPVVVVKDTTLAQAVEAAKPVLQAALDNFYGN